MNRVLVQICLLSLSQCICSKLLSLWMHVALFWAKFIVQLCTFEILGRSAKSARLLLILKNLGLIIHWWDLPNAYTILPCIIFFYRKFAFSTCNFECNKLNIIIKVRIKLIKKLKFIVLIFKNNKLNHKVTKSNKLNTNQLCLNYNIGWCFNLLLY